MKVFIWSSEYVVHIAAANTIEEAKSLLFGNTKEVGKFSSSVSEDDLRKVFLDDPVIIEGVGSIHLNHANE